MVTAQQHRFYRYMKTVAQKNVKYCPHCCHPKCSGCSAYYVEHHYAADYHGYPSIYPGATWTVVRCCHCLHFNRLDDGWCSDPVRKIFEREYLRRKSRAYSLQSLRDVDD